MKEELKDMPLFGGRNDRIKHEYDFSGPIDFSQIKVTFACNKEIFEKFKETIETNNLDINKILEYLVKSFNERK
jgi:hypothetical protein